MKTKTKLGKLKSEVLLSLLVLFCLFRGTAFSQNFDTPGEKVFTMAGAKNLFYNVNINDASAAIRIWGQELEKRLKIGVKFDLKIFDNLNDLLESPERDNFGFITLSSVDYLRYKSKYSFYPAFISGVCEEYVVLAKKEKAKKLTDLRGKKLALAKEDYNPIPEMWLDVLLAKEKLMNIKKFFRGAKEYNNESQIIMSVFFDQNDACIVTKKSFDIMKELNPQIGQSLTIIAQSPCYLIGLACMTKNSVKYKYKDKLIEELANMALYPEGRQILTLMKTEAIHPYAAGDLKTVETLMQEYDKIKKHS